MANSHEPDALFAGSAVSFVANTANEAPILRGAASAASRQPTGGGANGNRGGTASEMNFRRGLFRIWIIVSIVWTAGFLKMTLESHDRLVTQYPDLGWPFWFLERPVLEMSFPWLLTALALAVRWATKGFRPN
jgi:hypothetical protein